MPRADPSVAMEVAILTTLAPPATPNSPSLTLPPSAPALAPQTLEVAVEPNTIDPAIPVHETGRPREDMPKSPGFFSRLLDIIKGIMSSKN
ncbi:hypothetical protein BJV78DRAFT_1286428 [Lactifluus subvellereus]|nr:hypothetical protein BJV78DRAFT_1286428 [Lactifluus subvellereus]